MKQRPDEVGHTDAAGSPPPAPPARPAPSAGRRAGAAFKEVVVVAVLALVISAVIRGLIGQVFVIPSGSMEDTLQVGDRVAVLKIGDVERGDVVVFKDPGGWLPPAQKASTARKALEFIGLLPDTADQHLIKRLIGMPGDTVTCCDDLGRLQVNGVPLDETSYLEVDGGVQDEPALVEFKVVVPRDRIFVMGDNRNNSQDSRCHLADITTDGGPRGMTAFVPLDDVVGSAVAVVAPLDRFGRLVRPATFAAVPAAVGPGPELPSITPEGVGCTPQR